jgi:hypothetical protein
MHSYFSIPPSTHQSISGADMRETLHEAQTAAELRHYIKHQNKKCD